MKKSKLVILKSNVLKESESKASKLMVSKKIEPRTSSYKVLKGLKHKNKAHSR